MNGELPECNRLEYNKIASQVVTLQFELASIVEKGIIGSNGEDGFLDLPSTPTYGGFARLFTSEWQRFSFMMIDRSGCYLLCL
jgi:hypothetical protein